MPSLGPEHSCCQRSPMAGPGPFCHQLSLLQCSLGLRGFHFCALGDQPGFEVPFVVSSDALD